MFPPDWNPKTDPFQVAWQAREEQRAAILAGAASDAARELLSLGWGSDDTVSDADVALLASIATVDVRREGSTEPGHVYQPRRYDHYEVTLRDGRRVTFGLITSGYSEGYSFRIVRTPPRRI